MGFHDGELAVQRRAGVSDDAARLVGMLDPGDLSDGAIHVLARQTLAALTARDLDGRLWTSPLVAPAGFLDGSSGGTLRIRATPRPGDPLVDLPAGQQVALIAIDLPNRRRIRVNGHLSAADGTNLTVEIVEAFGNCPKYIHPHTIAAEGRPGARESGAETSSRLDDVSGALVSAADTFFLGTTNAERGLDSSHRGGEAGFVRIDRGGLWWPDYPGNNMFNSFGNLALDPTASLLFVDFDTSATLHLSGRGVVHWGATPDGSTRTDRWVQFAPERIVHVHPSGGAST